MYLANASSFGLGVCEVKVWEVWVEVSCSHDLSSACTYVFNHNALEVHAVQVPDRISSGLYVLARTVQRGGHDGTEIYKLLEMWNFVEPFGVR